jgi:NitT/TauT family transport system permease protein
MRFILRYTAALCISLLLWWAVALILRSPALPVPWGAFVSFFQELPNLLPHTGISLYRIAMAMFGGMVLALPLGLWIGRSPRLDTIAAPLLYLTYPIPKVVFLPVLLVLLGLNNAPKIVLIGIVIFFQTLVTARDSARNIPAEYLSGVRALGATAPQLARHVIVPAALPEIFTAMRINVGTAIAVLFLTESIAGQSGIGAFITQAWAMLNYERMFAGIIAMALLGVVLYEALNLVEKRFLDWKQHA